LEEHAASIFRAEVSRMRMWSGYIGMLDTGWSLRPTGGGQGKEHSLANWELKATFFRATGKCKVRKWLFYVITGRTQNCQKEKQPFLRANAEGK
jgi:hypothetical protein